MSFLTNNMFNEFRW